MAAVIQLSSISLPLWRFEIRSATEAKSKSRAPIQTSFMFLNVCPLAYKKARPRQLHQPVFANEVLDNFR